MHWSKGYNGLNGHIQQHLLRNKYILMPKTKRPLRIKKAKFRWVSTSSYLSLHSRINVMLSVCFYAYVIWAECRAIALLSRPDETLTPAGLAPGCQASFVFRKWY